MFREEHWGLDQEEVGRKGKKGYGKGGGKKYIHRIFVQMDLPCDPYRARILFKHRLVSIMLDLPLCPKLYQYYRKWISVSSI